MGFCFWDNRSSSLESKDGTDKGREEGEHDRLNTVDCCNAEIYWTLASLQKQGWTFKAAAPGLLSRNWDIADFVYEANNNSVTFHCSLWINKAHTVHSNYILTCIKIYGIVVRGFSVLKKFHIQSISKMGQQEIFIQVNVKMHLHRNIRYYNGIFPY